MAKLEQSRPRSELVEHLVEQRGFLESSAAAYDAGNTAEAKRLATAIRILVHDTKQSHSVLNQLGLKTTIRWVTTAPEPEPGNLAPDMGLVMLRAAPQGAHVSVEYWPPLDDLSPLRIREPQPFGDWWREGVMRPQGGVFFSRKQLVLGLAHKDGGAHVDPQLEESWAALTRTFGLGFLAIDDEGGEHNLGNPVLPAVIQIAHEVLRTLARIPPNKLHS